MEKSCWSIDEKIVNLNVRESVVDQFKFEEKIGRSSQIGFENTILHKFTPFTQSETAMA